MLKCLLIPLSWIYGGVVWFRNFLYDNKVLKSHEFWAPVVSIGNITVGGTGKTPHTEFIVGLLMDQFKVTILSRGYKRKTKGYLKASESSTVSDIGDEPKQMSIKFRGKADMVVCEERVEGITDILREKADNQLVVLDDAYQHRSVHPRVNILLVDYNRPIFEDHIMPWGRLRESWKEAHRANIIIITKCPETLSPIERRVLSKHVDLLPSQSIYFTNFKYLPLRPVFEGLADNMTVGPDTNILLLTGIANTDVLEEHIRKNLSEKITHIKFNDHHNFSKKDILKITEAFVDIDSDNKIIVTTEKDAMRLMELDFHEEIRKRMFLLPIEVNFVFDDSDNLKTQLLKYVAEDKGNYRLHTTVRQF
ncbi:MAG: tetraacyldisaccharide 4'-kinase [Bacteroidales bacterium]|nr:tetraacyldisaccharide 4'-kinase [Bacteroidales bacterium]